LLAKLPQAVLSVLQEESIEGVLQAISERETGMGLGR